MTSRVRRNRSGAAQAARCLTYPVQFGFSVEQLAPMTLWYLGYIRIGANWPRRYRAARAAPLVLPGRLRRNRSGAAQAARCLTYTVQFHLSVEQLAP
jgi:hypothetical protein